MRRGFRAPPARDRVVRRGPGLRHPLAWGPSQFRCPVPSAPRILSENRSGAVAARQLARCLPSRTGGLIGAPDSSLNRHPWPCCVSVRGLSLWRPGRGGRARVAGLLRRLPVQPLDCDQWGSVPDEVRPSDLEPRFVCSARGKRVPTCGRTLAGTRPRPTRWAIAEGSGGPRRPRGKREHGEKPHVRAAALDHMLCLWRKV